jgi:hypothetical protein
MHAALPRKPELPVGIEAEILELYDPVQVGITQTLDIDATREAAFNRCLDKLRGKSDLCRPGLSMKAWQRHIIAIANAGFGRMSRGHAVACIIEQQSGQEVVVWVSDSGSGGPLIR